VFLDLMLIMGREFEVRSENAWALRILKDRSAGDGTQRVTRLRDATLRHLSSKEKTHAGK
jgi:hypothetical protein